MVNGKKVWDGGALPTLKITPCQTTPLDRQSSATEESDGEKEDEESPTSAKEQPGADVIDEAVAVRIEEPPSVEDCKGESRNDHQQDNLEDPRHDQEELDGRNMTSMKHKIEDGCVASAGGINTEQELGLLLKCMRMDGRSGGESSVTLQKAETTASLGEKMQEQVDVPRVAKWTLADATGDETVCWDEQIVEPVAEEMPEGEMSEPMFIYPRFGIQAQQNDTQVNWHFPAGPGLIEEVRCPRWTFPLMSYYPVLESRAPFEGADQNVVTGEICEWLTCVNVIGLFCCLCVFYPVEWRVWEEREEWARAAEAAPVPFPFAKASLDFTVMSYNILADDLLMANLDLYAHCRPEVLDWSFRSKLVLEEILKWTPDVRLAVFVSL